MATPFDTPINIPFVLARINPAAEYHWMGGEFGTYADIGEWRSPEIPKPSEAAVYAEWDLYLKEQAQASNRDNALRNRLLAPAKSAVGVQVEELNAAQVRALLVLLLRKEGALAADGSIKPLNLWLK